MRPVHLIELEWPDFGVGARPDKTTSGEFLKRLDAMRAVMDVRGLTHLAVYGDREHFSNLHWLCGLDPRFEEALLVVRLDEKPLLLVGNECLGYLSVSPLHEAGELRHELYQPLSLISQPMDGSRRLRDIFAGEGVAAGARVGCVGWKYFPSHPDAGHSIEIPAFVVDDLRALAGHESVTNASDLFLHPSSGLRSTVSPSEIAYMEWTGTLASEGMKNMLLGLRTAVDEGWTDHDLVPLLNYNGEPLNCHVTLVTGENRSRGLSGPIGATIRRGDPFASNFGYWGSNICRAGWIAESAEGLPVEARDYVEAFAGPYFSAMNEWFGRMRIGAVGNDLYTAIHDNLSAEVFGIKLNPGHLIGTEEWTSSPVYQGSGEAIRSGMAIQVDVIPASSIYFSTRMEDGIVLADDVLQADLREHYPNVLDRCLHRRDFMRNVLGLDVHEDVLPTSNVCALVPPFLLDPNRVFAIG